MIPSRVECCGIQWNVEIIDESISSNGNAHYGFCDYLGHQIILLSQVHSTDIYNISRDIMLPDTEIYDTFLHEIWHMLCNNLSLTEINTEPNANIFAMAGMGYSHVINYGEKVAYKLNIEILEKFKEVVPDLSEDNYRRLKYAMENTLFFYDTKGVSRTPTPPILKGTSPC